VCSGAVVVLARSRAGHTGSERACASDPASLRGHTALGASDRITGNATSTDRTPTTRGRSPTRRTANCRTANCRTATKQHADSACYCTSRYQLPTLHARQ
jgi:hypothetical protein